MHIFKRGKIYWYEFVYGGKRYRRSTKLRNANDARDIASAFRTSLAKGEVGITAPKRVPSFKEAVADFLAWSRREHQAHPSTADRYHHSSAALLRFFDDVPINRISSEDVERFKLSRSGENRKTRLKQTPGRTAKSNASVKVRPATVNRELACMKALFNHAIKGNDDLRNPVNRVKFLAEQNQQDRVVSFAEQRLYLAVATPLLRDVATIILETGMRPEEVFNLSRSDVKLDESYLSVRGGKTPAAKRRLALTRAAAAVLTARMLSGSGSGYLFTHSKNPEKPIPNVHSAHQRAVKASGVLPFRLYDLRHTWATRAAEASIDPVTLAAMLGHSRIQMVLRYAHPQQAHQSSAMLRIEAANVAREIAEAGPIVLQ